MKKSRNTSLYNNKEDGCWICKNPFVECHHIYRGTGRRKVSDREGCYVFLCHEHHLGNLGVHNDANLNRFFHEDCQRRWERREGVADGDHSDFIAVFGQSYL